MIWILERSSPSILLDNINVRERLMGPTVLVIYLSVSESGFFGSLKVERKGAPQPGQQQVFCGFRLLQGNLNWSVIGWKVTGCQVMFDGLNSNFKRSLDLYLTLLYCMQYEKILNSELRSSAPHKLYRWSSDSISITFTIFISVLYVHEKNNYYEIIVIIIANI